MWACSAKKEGRKVKFMKNLTAHYNIYFNAKELLNKSEENINGTLVDDYSLLLEIFPKPNEQASASELGNLNEVIKKANTIAVEKYESNWLDDAYLLLAKSEFLKGDFYNAVEYYKYVSLTFPKSKKSSLEAYLGQVKTDFVLGNLLEADTVLQHAVKLKYKYFKEDVAATQAQMAIEKKNFADAVTYLQKAVNLTHNNQKKLRWMFVLAQLQELVHKTDAAAINYEKIAHSNAPFDLAFNADLSRIRISENANGKKFNRIETLNKLLKQDKNREFKEQIYYQIGIAYTDLNQMDKAVSFLQTSAHTTPSTEKQKGLSYLKLATLNFEALKNYTKAQLYYDSTLQYLPKNYPDYQNIALKAKNLQYLADRLTIIAKESSALRLANLSAAELDKKVDSIIAEKQKQISPKTDLKSAKSTLNPSDFNVSNQNGSTFYFYNSAAVAQGLNEFKKRWGNRKLTDDWRSNAGSLNANDPKSGIVAIKPLSNSSNALIIDRDSIKSELEKTIPYSPAEKELANDKISNALYEIAIFYKDILKDDQEAAEALAALVLNYPNYPNLDAVYFQLYRLLQNTNFSKSEEYKDQLLKKFPNSIYAKTIANPNFGKEESLSDDAISKQYEIVYAMYLQKDYQKVLAKIEFLKDSLSSFRKLSPQFDYLKTLAIGHREKLPVFLAGLNSILQNYPNDTLVVSLVKQQIDFINKNKSELEQRSTALIDREEPKKIIVPEVQVIIPKQKDTLSGLPENKVEDSKKETIGVNTEKLAEKTTSVETVREIPKEVIFSDNIRQRHVLVIDITDPKVNIAKPFSLLSQYFYTKYSTSAVNLVIRLIGNSDKFIIVSGNFYSKAEVEKIAAELKDSLPKIMEGQTNQYTYFVISESNLNLIKDRSAIELYIKSNLEKE